ncbi:MAG: hypothetical protein M1483_03740 [Actinobacteria bacterium]|nr:hypothetical protein [Actinomycetota bacterium]MCL6104736.1 hypothetical protein [Actinomycetota bacterium]
MSGSKSSTQSPVPRLPQFALTGSWLKPTAYGPPVLGKNSDLIRERTG